MINVLGYIHQYISLSASSYSLAFFRVIFGMLMLFSALRFIVLGWIDEQYIQPSFHFSYYGFEFVQVYSPEFVYGLFGCVVLSTMGIILGLYYRISIVLFFLVFTYIELIDKTYYLNHYYFISVMACILCFTPAHIVCSIDSKRKPSIIADTVPRYYEDYSSHDFNCLYICGNCKNK